jgi:DNA-binding protein Fis
MQSVHFLSNSSQIDKITKGLSLSKSLYVSILLIGKEHTGKKTFIQSLFPTTIYVDAANEQELSTALDTNNELIIYNFEKIINIESLNFENKRIIAIANTEKEREKCTQVFSFIYEMPKLKEREDLDLLIKYFQKKIQYELMIKDNIELNKEHLDFTQNIKSLKASIYKQLIIKTFKKEDIQDILFNYLFDEVEGNNAYREHLGLYEKPLLEAGLKKYKSQLKLAGILGLNRNTLRKKIQEHGLN